MTDFINDLIPLLIPALLSVVTWFVTRALIAVRERFGAETERILRQELDKAMARGIAVAATRRSPLMCLAALPRHGTIPARAGEPGRSSGGDRR